MLRAAQRLHINGHGLSSLARRRAPIHGHSPTPLGVGAALPTAVDAHVYGYYTVLYTPTAERAIPERHMHMRNHGLHERGTPLRHSPSDEERRQGEQTHRTSERAGGRDISGHHFQIQITHKRHAAYAHPRNGAPRVSSTPVPSIARRAPASKQLPHVVPYSSAPARPDCIRAATHSHARTHDAIFAPAAAPEPRRAQCYYCAALRGKTPRTRTRRSPPRLTHTHTGSLVIRRAATYVASACLPPGAIHGRSAPPAPPSPPSPCAPLNARAARAVRRRVGGCLPRRRRQPVRQLSAAHTSTSAGREQLWKSRYRHAPSLTRALCGIYRNMNVLRGKRGPHLDETRPVLACALAHRCIDTPRPSPHARLEFTQYSLPLEFRRYGDHIPGKRVGAATPAHHHARRTQALPSRTSETQRTRIHSTARPLRPISKPSKPSPPSPSTPRIHAARTRRPARTRAARLHVRYIPARGLLNQHAAHRHGRLPHAARRPGTRPAAPQQQRSP
ncbi:hypothetical protein HYPSUDRAFT_214355 [Hypholoma sublateritium FD-334 SS-4]|uniref:Uncharacterized protein n=1 Tax=Hypholoma sublateritium (strain FD-334 SS-4) TaxID=945553 RepID=A0A0D2LC33_HYPSF|nr:hypothetical protein HYPSUDRAFT_214355 [Hypholoma sublateritium FD-334 SS-4]